ncbi:hypothetical protein N7456_001064 [Penicillium angulare]|uniref:Major facilitator superfamily (MFS) profile domain-containing protein n=1 Tax=Penicillium angulare TaxID=116970 RepID=A0A9W9KSY0_9EURO|nr:hypothetical protein N7456_001064 [Penicillium angulare]
MATTTPNENSARSWLVVFGAFSALFCSVGFLNSYGVFESYYATSRLADKSESTIGWIGAICIFFLFSISTVAGALLDFFGPEVLICSGSIVYVFGIMMISLCKEYYQFLLAQGFLLGTAMSLLTWPPVALVGKYMKQKRAAAMGIVIAGSSLGGVIWPIAIDHLLKKPNIGFPWTMRIVGFIMIPLLLFACTVCRSPPAPAPIQDAGSENKADGSDGSHHSVDEKPVNRKAEIIAFYKQPALQLLCLAMFFTYFGMFSPFFYTTSYAVEKGYSSSLAFYTVSVVNGASFPGRIIPGLVADRLGKFNCAIVASLSAGIIALCWTKADSVTGLFIWCAAYGFASGGILSLQQACAAQVSTSASTLGLAIGSVAGSTCLSAMANVPISGALAGKYGYLSLSLFSGISLLLGGVLLIMARLVQSRELFAIV